MDHDKAKPAERKPQGRRTPGTAEGEDSPPRRTAQPEPGPTPGTAEGDLETAEQNANRGPPTPRE